MNMYLHEEAHGHALDTMVLQRQHQTLCMSTQEGFAQHREKGVDTQLRCNKFLEGRETEVEWFPNGVHVKSGDAEGQYT
jgi:hypothetical protein